MTEFALLSHTLHAQHTHHNAYTQASAYTHKRVCARVQASEQAYTCSHKRIRRTPAQRERIMNMAKKTAPQTAQTMVVIGPLELSREWLLAQAAESFGKSGVYVTNEREKVTIIADDGRPVKYAITFSVQRDALNDDEQSECDKAATAIESRKATKAEADQKERERSVKAAFDLGQSSTMTAIKNIGDLAAGARALSQLNR